MDKALRIGEKILTRFFSSKTGAMKKQELQAVLKNLHVIVSKQQKQKNRVNNTSSAEEDTSNQICEKASLQKQNGSLCCVEESPKSNGSNHLALSASQNAHTSLLNKTQNNETKPVSSSLHSQTASHTGSISLNCSNLNSFVKKNVSRMPVDSRDASAPAQASVLRSAENLPQDARQKATDTQLTSAFNMTGSLSDILKHSAKPNSLAKADDSAASSSSFAFKTSICSGLPIQKDSSFAAESAEIVSYFNEKSKSSYVFEICEDVMKQVDKDGPPYSFTLFT